MKFRYSARNKQGELQVGIVEAASRDAAIAVLNSHDLFVLSVVSAEKRTLASYIANIFNRVSSKDIVIFSRQLATLLSAKVPLADSLKILYRQTENKILREVVFDINTDVSAGVSFSQALARHPQVFSEFFVNMMRAAEVTGRVDKAVSFMADYLEKQSILTGKIRNALIYPAFVVVLFGVVVGIMVIYVFPQVAPIFEETGVEIPIYTRIMLGTGEFLIEWWWAVLAILLVGGIALADYVRSEEGKILVGELQIRLPVLGDLFSKMYLTRFAQATSVLVAGGVSVVQALRISARTIGNIVFQEELEEVAERVKEGELMSAALERSPHFPPLVANLVAIGETAGKVDELLNKISDFYTRQVDDKVGSLVELIQPVLMVVIAVFVGVLFASILLPIYNLAQAF